MSETTVNVDAQKACDASATTQTTNGVKLAWVPPKMEDVSEQVMAQPYIRFT